MPEKLISGDLGTYLWQKHDGQTHIWILLENTKKRPLVSINPTREASRILGNFVLKEGYLAIVLGAASLQLIQLLQKQRQENGGEILVVEKDSRFLKEWVALFPEFFRGIVLLSPENREALENYLENLAVEKILGYRIFSLPGSFSLDPNFYQEEEKRIKELLATKLSDLFTRVEFEERWVWNSLTNLLFLPSGKAVKNLFQTMAGRDAILISTGPSLRQSLPWLKKLEKKAFLACADSAYRVLHSAQITPHLIFTLDSQSYTLRHFLGLPCGKKGEFPILVADIVANPQVIFRWQGDIFWSTTVHFGNEKRVTTPGYDFLEEYFLNGESLGDIQSGGSVATSLFDLLRQMNFSRIFLVGQDLAYTYRQIHSTGTHHTLAWISQNTNRFWPVENIEEAILHKRHIWPETSLNGKKILADYVLSLYRKWLGDAAFYLKGRVYQASADGLFIENTLCQKFSEDFLPVDSHFPNEKILLYLEKSPPVFFSQSHIEKIFEFYEKLAQKTAFPFLKYVGRKYEILAQRTEEAAKKTIFLEKKKAREKIFQERLSLYSKNWLKKLSGLYGHKR